MNGPRVAALAEALTGYYLKECVPRDRAEEDAAAILDALPPDWCGHTTWQQTDTFNVWTGTCGHLWLATTGPDCPTCAEFAADDAEFVTGFAAEIARLRRIEEAARAVADDWFGQGDTNGRLLDLTASMPALRAALEEKP